MHRPPATSGEVAVWNLGHRSGKSFLRHRTLPFSASRQDRVPQTPSVTTFPSATVGELRGPPCTAASGPLTAGAPYLSCHSSLPVAAFRQRITSLLPSRAN